jgi:glucose/arabinose dehydrogenase
MIAMRVCLSLLLVVCSGPMAPDAGTPDGGMSERDGGRDAARDAGRSSDGGDDGGSDAGDDGGRDAGPLLDDAGPLVDGGDAGMVDPCSPRSFPSIGREEIVSGLTQPIYVTQPPGITDSLYVVEKWGRIQIVRGGAVVGTFLDLRPTIAGSPPTIPSDGEERGLLGLAFHPDYATNGRFFVYYLPFRGTTGRMLLEEYRRSAGDPNVADTTPVRSFLEDGVGAAGYADPESNHNGGMIEFWPRSGGGPYYLYLAIGDGGDSCDRHGSPGNGQDRASIFGKIHRLDVDGTAPYAAPGNPFTGAGELRTIWSYGLRNPWRFTFDRMTGDMYIGDVGQGAFEEFDFAPAGTSGQNFGWRPLEGNCSSAVSSCTSPYSSGTCLSASAQLAAGYTAPVHVEPRGGGGSGVLGMSIAGMGGYVYRGSAIPGLQGWYLFGDYISRNRGAFWVCGGIARDVQRVTSISGVDGVVSFGEDNAGELYMVHEVAGTIDRIVPM